MSKKNREVGDYEGKLARLVLAFHEAILQFPDRREEFFMLFAHKAMETARFADLYKKHYKKLRRGLFKFYT